MTHSEAEQLVEGAKTAFFKPFEELGVKVKEGEPDLDGKPFTQERVEKIHRLLEEGCWGILSDHYEITGEEPES